MIQASVSPVGRRCMITRSPMATCRQKLKNRNVDAVEFGSQY